MLQREEELIVAAVDQVDDDFDDGFFFFRAAFGDEQGQGHQGIVGQALGAVGAVENGVAGEILKP